ncbi:MAG: Gfo/Idh/MocA family oxidoreductase [Bacteroidales bacterium]|nr:Gfo/Idh/MocA family oxidoreductase [Bacteroidales bacterium]MCF8405434.1 Gfo/Idh/MocA family oxidoreductase [Bacteroidales bacterium]
MKLENQKDKNSISRRKFIGNVATAAAGFTILPSTVISGFGYRMPSDKLNIVGIGVGGVGATNVKHCATENIIALCDVDWSYAAGTFEKYPDAKKYKDFRKMFDELGKDIDAVIVATPDHTHAIIAAQAIRMGKHVYVQKPLTHTVYESRLLKNLANEYKVATQMGNQGNSGDGIRQTCEWIWDGAIGEITEVHAWTNRPIWPQGLERPTETPSLPPTLDWDNFIGPAAWRPYHPSYTPWNWRAWWDFGTGALGDMACHIVDPAFWALKLGHPTSINASSTQVNTESAPYSEMVHYEFPDRGKIGNIKLPPLKMTWYDGGLMPPRPEELPDGQIMGDRSGGVLFVGTKGKLMTGCYGRGPILLPGELDADYKRPEPSIRRIADCFEGGHEGDWIRACKENPESRVQTSSNFNYSGPLNEMVVMGNLAVRLQDLKRKLLWDGENMKITNISDEDEIRVVTTDKFNVIDGHPHFDTQYQTMKAKPAAEEYIKHTYREGWKL